MIKATELRIGNLLKDAVSGELMTVDEIGENIGATILDRSKYPLPDGWVMAPIPLTEEWVQRMGFKFLHDGKPRRWCHSERRWFDLSGFGSGEEMAYLNMPSATPVQFVHQLQNLFYCLTGQELEVKP